MSTLRTRCNALSAWSIPGPASLGQRLAAAMAFTPTASSYTGLQESEVAVPLNPHAPSAAPLS
eukprot:11575145-Heterocapsa_arctica.AAC.1